MGRASSWSASEVPGNGWWWRELGMTGLLLLTREAVPSAKHVHMSMKLAKRAATGAVVLERPSIRQVVSPGSEDLESLSPTPLWP